MENSGRGALPSGDLDGAPVLGGGILSSSWCPPPCPDLHIAYTKGAEESVNSMGWVKRSRGKLDEDRLEA